MDNMVVTPAQQNGLMKAMNFSDKDLDLNRMGVLSDKQRRRLRWNQIGDALLWWLLAFTGAFPMIFPNHWRLDGPSLLFSLGSIVVGVGMAFWRQYQVSQALKENKVAVITGMIRKTQHTENKSQIYRAIMEGKKFQVSETTYFWLMEDRQYSFYYVPQNGELVSIGRPLTEEEKIRFSFSKPYDSGKAKRTLELDDDIEGLSEESRAPASFASRLMYIEERDESDK